jgi:hypothetical protein
MQIEGAVYFDDPAGNICTQAIAGSRALPAAAALVVR